ncbi:hypothetical protein AQJ66_13630 [Streptomyces bungoensis]|uniref:DNA-binding protein n=1 Tax=Streptomyces bungoensis TaxID=285568 RepID=A0A124I420_9ACTN|nr:hypothetical protein [Streptomyces bungoensis]KUN85544.1 hypothetical protein AQJ66_13630 [Streptomyces bungoensis]
MIYRHCIAPPRAYTQFSHDIIRHPRLSSDAVRLLTWQLSLPQGTRESLSRTAERANIGACAFTRAKRQLKDEGFVHERRVQGPGGHWVTQQLVSNVPLNPAEAAKLLARMPVTPSPQVAPSPRNPAAGERTGRLTDGLPYGDTHVDTHNQPPKPPEDAPDAPAPAEAPEAPHASPAPEAPQAQVDREDHEDGRPHPPTPHLEEARTLAASYRDLDPALRTIPRAMHAELTDLTARWLAAGHPPAAIRAHILRNLPDGDTRVHRPGGLLRYLLTEVPPVPPALASPPPRNAPPHAPQERPGLSTRLATLRECEGDHVQATLFRPTGEEPLCPACTARTTTVPM